MSVAVYSGAQMKALDTYAIEQCGIPSLKLMETAAARIREEIQKRTDLSGKRCVVLCGKGNNGGDGFAVACMLSVLCAQICIVCMASEDALSPDALHYYKQAMCYGIEILSDDVRACAAISEADIVVDALYGFGFKGELSGVDAKLVRAVNASSAFVVSADIPSGISADGADALGVHVQADLTVTFTGYKRSSMLFDSAYAYGEIAVADIGIPSEAKAAVAPLASVTDVQTVKTALGERRRNMHKGDFGKIFVLGGSRGMSGAVYLSAQAALKSGAGLVCAGVPECLSDIMEIKTTEVMTLALSEAAGGLSFDAVAVKKANAYDALAFGMGAGRDAAVQNFLKELLARVEKPILIDADGLYALSKELQMLQGHKQTVVLTPHSGEMARLCGKTVQEVEQDRVSCAKALATAYNVYVVLKGAFTVIAAPDGRVAMQRSVGNSGMATAGSGDVLSGIGALMLSRTPDAFSAMQAAVYIHALAGDFAAAAFGEDGMTAGDLLAHLPSALKEIRAN